MENNLGNKEIMAKNILRLMELHDKDRKQVCNDLDISYTTFTDWVKARTYPRIDKIELMAKYFGVQKADLVEEYKPEEQAYYLDEETREYVDFLHKNPEHKVLFDASRKVSKEDINKALKAIGLFIDEE